MKNKIIKERNLQKIQKIIQKYSIINSGIENCKKCKGTGKFRIWEKKKVISEHECIYCNKGKINPLEKVHNENEESIIKRVIDNFSYSDEKQIKDDFIDCLTDFSEGKKNISKNVKNELESEFTRYSTAKFIEDQWNKSKKRNLSELILIYSKYFLRDATYAQMRDIRKVIGINKNWRTLGLDYYQCHKMISDIDKEILNSKKEIKVFSKFDEKKRHEIQEKNKKFFSREDIIRDRFITQLVWCIENLPQKYKFNLENISSLKPISKKILFSKIQNSSSKYIVDFKEDWIFEIEENFTDIYEMDKELFKNIIKNLDETYNQKEIIIKDLEIGEFQFQPIEDYNGLTYDYKRGTLANEIKIREYYGKFKKNHPNRSEDELNRMAIKAADEELMNKIKQTICAFLNTNGGRIIIGVDDNGKVIGVEEYKKRFESRQGKSYTVSKFIDEYRMELQDIINHENQPDINYNWDRKINIETISIESKNQNQSRTLIVIQIKKAKDKAWYIERNPLEPKIKGRKFFRRRNGKNENVQGKEFEKMVIEDYESKKNNDDFQ